jgi:hypothetical protein
MAFANLPALRVTTGVRNTIMSPVWSGIVLSFACAAWAQSPSQRAGSNRAPEAPRIFAGKVILLRAFLEAQKVKVDADSVGTALVLEAEGGKTFTLLKDDASRMLFLDEELRGRPVRLTGRLVPGSQLLQVTRVETVVEGKIHEVYYWCDKCQLKATQPGPCKCCGEPVVRQEVPIK